MNSLQKLLSDSYLWAEGVATIIAFLHLKGLKGKYWRFFVYFLALVFVCEAFGKWGGVYISFSKTKYYNYFVIPFQFIFFYWLYAFKSLNNKKLFWTLSLLYLLSFIPSEFYFKGSKIIFSFNYTFGSFILMVLVVMEYYKQITSSDIINFNKNRMFYVNLGVTLFYIGTLPFWTFYYLLVEYKQIWSIYFYYFLISGIVMYALFSISFIWGKQNS
ncbi:hypothetical protein ASE74_11175 [Pedobacter sp. Leaf216]|uniref:hypothetical protein n=1 Tax=Pedobacter sp. Leaf216 TaxID=1735684 RepID=UPI0006F6D483|nr:hypothetical protein [Pedobacter sp. Leaf216]KQM64575.1 hypothetical protein ASE74_11175 [Pedobacter sp. Leaf216]